MTAIAIAVIVVVLVAAYIIGRPATRSFRQPDFEFDGVKGWLLYYDIWEVESNQIVYRARSRIFPQDNVWVTKDGKVPSAAEHRKFVECVERYRKTLTDGDPWK